MDKVLIVDQHRVQFNVPMPWGTAPGSLRLPFKHGLNPHADAAARQNSAWAVETGLIPRTNVQLLDALDRCRFEQLSSLVHHNASLEALQLITNCFTAIFVFDDMIDDSSSEIGSSKRLAQHVTAYLGAALADEPRPLLSRDVPERQQIIAVGDALANVAQRLLDFTDRPGIAEYVSGMRHYLLGCVIESEKRNDHVRSIADYAAVRLRCSAMFPCFDAGAIVEGYKVPAHIWNDVAFQNMRKATNLCVSYVNDIFSYGKESSVGELSNLVTVNQMVNGHSLEQALAASININDKVVASYLDAKAQLRYRHRLDESTRGYISMMEGWMRGNFDWYSELRTARYTDYLTTAIVA